MWLGDYLKPAINLLLKEYKENRTDNQPFQKKIMVLHWSPSEIIKSNVQYEMITMPRCEDMNAINVTCKYELTPLLKYYSNSVTEAPAIHDATLYVHFTDADLDSMFQQYDEKTNSTQAMSLKDIIQNSYTNLKLDTMKTVYNDIACNWIKTNEKMYSSWNVDKRADEIIIGGIFPITGEKASYTGKLYCIFLNFYFMVQFLVLSKSK